MSQTKADKLLSRITALHRSLQLDDEDDAPSRLERDLMLGYLRDLYAVYLDAGTDAPRKPTPAELPDPKPAPPSPKPAPTHPSPAPEVPAPKPEPPAPAPRPEAPAPASPPEAPDVPVPPPPAPPVAEHTAKINPEFKRPAPNPPQPSPAPNTGPGVQKLFQDTDDGGLANRLMRQRVTDLTRSLSINNRVLFSKKLFRDNEELNAALKELNLRGSFDNAKPLLVDLAQEHRWAEEEREETAKEFIDLVRRRYA
ncbi:hypothetical protein [Lewinella sp. IMCC34183]|uniref:hypothetical protein n=1 Tax=Lewinella sp. IMCC34183 TaxID=2248762 RepID=UPI000E21D07C|nr:hypothetical protein [Lewinella sp. IMCC34183]